MTFKKKSEQPVGELAQEKSTWKFEDGVTADSSPELRAQWLAEYKRRLREVLPKHDVKSPLFTEANQ
jgi:hypothetical protein